MNSLLLTGGRVIDPANRLDTTTDLLVPMLLSNRHNQIGMPSTKKH